MNEKITILCLSDSHGSMWNFGKVLERCPRTDAVIFLGDGLSDAEKFAELDRGRSWFAVRGNCDFSSSFLGNVAKKTDEIILCNKKIIFTHGDLYGAKYGLDGLERLASERDADIVLYGHTHIAKEDYIDGVYYLNPGCVKTSSASSFGLLTLDGDSVLFSISEL